MIVLVDMNCFFASVEQLDNPAWRNKPVAVTNGLLGTTIITCSYEARAYGVTTGMRLKQARVLCPELIQAPSRPQRYAAISTSIMDSLTVLTPDIEIYSVDEAFLDLTGCQHFYSAVEQIGRKLKQLIRQASGGLNCSVGISGDKTTAKFAAKQQKPDGLVVIHPDAAETALAEYPVTALSGINKGIASFLAQYNVVYCKQMKDLPIGILAKRYGNVGRRIWLMAQGKDPKPLLLNVAAPKTIGHGKNLPPETRDKQIVLTYFQHMAEKVAARLRLHHYYAISYVVALKTQQGWFKWSRRSLSATNDGQVIYRLCRQCVDDFWGGQGVWQVRIVALDPQQHIQNDLFIDDDSGKQGRAQLNEAVDMINTRYGEFAVAPASLLNRSKMPNVIAPAWKPQGHRKTV